MSDYAAFLRQKIKLAQFRGFEVSPDEVNPGLKPHTRDIVRWDCLGGQRANFASFGLHKTATQLEVMRLIGIHRPGLRGIVLPLGVRQEFFREVLLRFQGEYAVDLRFIRSDSEIGDERTIYMTNYESVREDKVDVSTWRAASLDEASVLRSYGSKTYQEFLPRFERVEFKFVNTATPSPNRFKELIHYAGFLGVMDTGQALTRFAPDDHFVVWHDLEDERRALQEAIPEAVSVWGTQDLDEREQRIVDFGDGKHRVLSTKPVIAGSGCNFQRHCHREVFAGIGFKFNDFIQSIHRVQRFGQADPVRIDIVYSEAEREILRTLLAKWERHNEMQATMTEIIRKFGLNQLAMQETLARTLGIERIAVSGERFSVANNDCVEEAKLQPEASVDLIVTSIPFANHYEYSPSYNDFGHTEDNAHFWAQMDFLTPELLRILKHGRIYACHVKDRINFGNVTGFGLPTSSPFHCEATMHGIKHGFDYLGMVTVVTDVVRENNQTYRLGYTEMCKDGTKMGVGSPEYILLFHKPQTDRTKGYADDPVKKSKGDYSLARWQVDAHAFWRSSGNRTLTAEEMAGYGPAKLAKMFTEFSLANVYDFDFHVRIGEELQERGALPSTFMSLAPGSHHPNVWHDVIRMRTLNGEQANRAVEKHVCPLQFDIVDRLIERFSNKGERVYDPFSGLGTVPVRAVALGRIGSGSELNPSYFLDQVHYLKAEERVFAMPTLFDLEGLDAEQVETA